MASINDVLTLIQRILAKANAKTSKNDTNIDDAVDSLVSLCLDTSTGDATAKDILSGKKAWVDGAEVTGTMPIYDSENMDGTGKAIATREQGVVLIEGTIDTPCYVDGSVYLEVDDQQFGDALVTDVLADKTFTSTAGFKVKGNIPTKTSSDLVASGAKVTVPKGYYASSAEKTVKDDNLIASNIKKGVSIFGVVGNYEGSSIPTCNITVTFSYNPQNVIIYFSVLDEGEITNNRSSTDTGSTLNLENVVCGSTIYISARNSFYIYNWAGDFSMFSITAAAFVPRSAGNYTLDIGMLDD